MPATKKRKAAKKTVNVIEKKMEMKVETMSEQMQMMLLVFAVAMMAFAFVLYKVYVK